MMPPLPPTRPKTFLGTLTQAVQTVQAKINVSRLKLKPGARVPELWVQAAGDPQAKRHPLLGDRYRLGRSANDAEIVVASPVVSKTHLSLHRTPGTGWLGFLMPPTFLLKDENSTNGIFRGRRRIHTAMLRHGAVYTLGPPELEESVRIKFYDPPPWYVRTVQYSLYGVGGGMVLTAIALLLEWQKFDVSPLPLSVQGPVIVYARDGETPLNSFTNRTHAELRSLSEFAPNLPKAVIASEDSRFYWHLGVDPIGVVRAVVTNLRGGGIREGGSTLTQQLARSLFRSYVGTEDSAARKLREAAVALKLETFYSKDVLLLTYLNRVYLGSGNYGFEDAAQFYFGKSAKVLTLSEAATLAGILPAPNRYNPVRDYQQAVEQRNGVLQRMLELGMISPEEASRARRSRLEVNPKAKLELESTRAPYYYDQVFSDLQTLLGEDLAKEGNFIVETGLDLGIQSKAEVALRQAIATTVANAGISQGAIATLDATTGEVVALVGGVDYKQSQFNRASQAFRQPGSTFKIFAYTAALAQGVSPGAAFSCAPLNWEGQFFEGCHSGGGSVDLYTGMAQSENVVALRIARQAGLDRIIQLAHRMGIHTDLKPVPGLVLGQSEVTLLDLTGAFSVLANQGIRNRPTTIRRILDSSDCQDRQDLQTCRVIFTAQNDSEHNQPIVSAEVATMMTELLRGVVQSGTGRAAAIAQGEAGKTGTTNNNVDLWFVGYIPGGLVTGVWLGNDDSSPTAGSSALAAQLP